MTAILGFFIGLGYLNHPTKWLLGKGTSPEEEAHD
jgi:hypothetical protein